MLLDELKSIVGPEGWVTDDSVLAPHLTEWRGAVRGRTALMVSPASTEQVAAVVRACARQGVAVVPQGGNTGMCAGAVPDDSGEQILINLSRMNRVREVNAADFSMIAEAGCILANLQEAARAVNRILPLSFGSEGSCQIGGNVSTNAGGLNVIRYGCTRNLVLGLEVVLADGTVWNGLRTLGKDTAGYDLKQMFIGSEGTLGIVTAVSLRLSPRPGETATALLALDRAANATTLLAHLQQEYPDRIQQFELVAASCFDLVEEHIGLPLPFDDRSPWYVMLEVETGGNGEAFEQALMECFEQEWVIDAIIAKSDAEAEKLWRLRHSISEAEKRAGVGLKHDISVPLAMMATYIDRAEALLADALPDASIVAFGHVGDGNLHYNVVLPKGLTDDERERQGKRATALVYDLVADLGGSFSAEHGVGYLKREYLVQYRDKIEMRLMRTLKSALDPDNILNPGKVIEQ